MTDHITHVRACAEEAQRADSDLRAAVVAAVDAGEPISRVAESAGISRPTAYDWIKRSDRRAWTVSTSEWSSTIEATSFHPEHVAESMTEARVRSIDFDGQHPDRLDVGEQTIMVVRVGHSLAANTWTALTWRVERIR